VACLCTRATEDAAWRRASGPYEVNLTVMTSPSCIT
jgi:hypothetical protein